MTRRVVLSLALLLAVSWPAVASAGDGAIARAIEDLRSCDKVDAHVCRSLPARLTAYGDDAVPPVQAAFGALSQAGKVLSIIALRAIETPRSSTALVKLAKTSDIVVRTMIVGALGERVGKVVDKALIAALRDKNSTVRQSAAEALGRRAEQRNRRRVVAALLKSAGDPAVSVARTAMESVALFRDARVLPLIRRALVSEDVAWRKSGLFCLRFSHDKSLVPPVIELLRDADGVVLRDAVRSLQRMTGREYGADYHLWRGWWDSENEVDQPLD
ncbi:MAG: HEAT repeat protein [Myxococcota bacterium]|jgi:HEAT repeat protein